ncbi:carbohydrate ABC transporter permease [Paenibacillus paridis]|uniref:carbohydrate ABC transporter permease n=1 Tax=Paenibacillus paridis TaxID=2583376 RepID=UPI001EE4B581|nr:carbohydrate ABC transporter permease [Paenibacillus paridis]
MRTVKSQSQFTQKPSEQEDTQPGMLNRFRDYLIRKHIPERVRVAVIGRQVNDGLLFKALLVIILISIAVLYVKPLLYMMSTSVKTLPDLLDTSIQWIPRQFEWLNYGKAIDGLKYWRSLGITAFIALSAAVLQTIACGVTGYAFARLYIPGKKIWFAIVILTFLIPQQTLVIPLYVTYVKLGWLNTVLPFIVPAIVAQGIKGSLFIIIFRQFFSTLPKELEESARMDGAGAIRTFWKIMIPLSRPALLIVFLFSFVWHWNDYFEPALYLKGADFYPLSLSLQHLQSNLNYLSGSSSGLTNVVVDVNEPIKMAAAFLIILPPLVLYLFAQRYFVEGIERTGIVE